MVLYGRTTILLVLLVAAGCAGLQSDATAPNGATTQPGSEQADVPTVKLVASYPTANGSVSNVTLLTTEEDHFADVGEVQQGGDFHFVPVGFSESGAREFADTLNRTGFTDEGVNRCNRDQRTGYCLLTVIGEEVVYATSLGPGLADLIESGETLDEGEFALGANNESTAERLRNALLRSD